MNSFISKVSLTFLVASTAFTLPSCENDDGDPQRNPAEKGLPSFGDAIHTNAVRFVIGDVGYMGAEHSAKTVPGAKGFWAYNIKTKVWSQVADFPGSGRKDATALILKGKAFIADSKEGSDVWEYDPGTNGWTK
jgi:hypothetical protein